MRLFGKLTGNEAKPVETYQCILHINTHCCVSKTMKFLETQQNSANFDTSLHSILRTTSPLQNLSLLLHSNHSRNEK
jgi:hypothetical protein